MWEHLSVKLYDPWFELNKLYCKRTIAISQLFDIYHYLILLMCFIKFTDQNAPIFFFLPSPFFSSMAQPGLCVFARKPHPPHDVARGVAAASLEAVSSTYSSFPVAAWRPCLLPPFRQERVAPDLCPPITETRTTKNASSGIVWSYDLCSSLQTDR